MMKGFATNAGQNWQGILWMIMGSVTLMEPGLDKTVLLGTGMLVVGMVAFATKGSGITPEEGEQIKQRLDEADMADIIRRGREP